MVRQTVNPGFRTRLLLAVVAVVWLLPVPVHAFSLEDLAAAINTARATAHLTPLSLDGRLGAAARTRLETIMERGSIKHTPDDETRLRDAAIRFGLTDVTVAENLSSDLDDAVAIVNAWLGSTPHRRNLLSDNATMLGVAVDTTGFSASPAPVVVALFAGPAPAAPTTQSNARLIVAVAATAALFIALIVRRELRRTAPQRFNPFR